MNNVKIKNIKIENVRIKIVTLAIIVVYFASEKKFLRPKYILAR